MLTCNELPKVCIIANACDNEIDLNYIATSTEPLTAKWSFNGRNYCQEVETVDGESIKVANDFNQDYTTSLVLINENGQLYKEIEFRITTNICN